MRPLEDLALEISDDNFVDWEGIASALSGEQAELARQFEGISAIARLSRQVTREPERWGDFEIIEKLGEGAYSEVFRAHDPVLDRDVALKLLDAAPEGEADSLCAEGRRLARIKHPHVVSVYGAAYHDRRVGLWMEILEGRDLHEILQSEGRFGWKEVVSIGVDLCGAVAAIHGVGLLHRDVKAQNVIREEGGRLVLMDLGIGQEIHAEERSAPAGTPLYMDPELLLEGKASVQSDLYALGVLLFYLLTGTFPVRASTIEELKKAHQEAERERLLNLRPETPKALIRVIERALCSEPEERPQTAGEMATALSDCLIGEEVQQEERQARSFGFQGRKLALTSFLIAVILIAGWMSISDISRIPVFFTGHTTSSGAVTSEEKWVLVSEIENHTGEEALEGTIRAALERHLPEYGGLYVASPARIADTLSLMRKPKDTAVNAELAREIALRDGGINRIITGEIRKAKGDYAITLRLLNPLSNEVEATENAEALERAEVLEASRELAGRMARTLGEGSSQTSAEASALYERATTTSLEALRLYTLANELVSPPFRGPAADRWAQAEPLFQRAIERDPQFASAHLMLFWAKHNQQREAEAWPHLQRAVELADSATAAERGFIEGTYYHMLSEKLTAQIEATAEEKEVERLEERRRRLMHQAHGHYLVVLEHEPDHPWAAGNIVFSSVQVGVYDQMEDLVFRRARGRPNDLVANFMAAEYAMQVLNDWEAANPFLQRASLLARKRGAARTAVLADLGPVLESWLAGEIDQSFQAFQVFRQDALTREYPRVPFLFRSANVALTLGLLDQAKHNVRSLLIANYGFAEDYPWSRYQPLLVSYATGDMSFASEILAENSLKDFGTPLEFILALKLRPALAEYLDFQELRIRPVAPGDLGHLTEVGANLVRGEVALLRQDYERAVRLLSSGVQRIAGVRPYTGAIRVLAGVELGQAWAALGRPELAIETLERASGLKTAAFADGGFFWLEARAHLIPLYRTIGRLEKARAIEVELREHLKYADPDHPILQRLTKTSG